MSALTDSAKALIDPVDGARAFVEARRIVLPLLLVAAAVAFSGAAFALRWDAAPAVIRDLGAEGQLQKLTEQELADKITTAWRARLVGGIATGVFVMPALILALAVALKLTAWLFGKSLAFAAATSLSVLTLLPKVIFHLAFGAAALRQSTVDDRLARVLLPSNLASVLPGKSPPLTAALAAVDFFNLWAVVLLGFGFSFATGMRRWRALLLALVLFALYVAVFQVGLPGLLEGATGGGPRGPRGGR